MIFRQIPHDDLGCASYLIGDDDAGVAAVVDPKFEIDEYLELARYMGVSIEHILETHNHADHVSGQRKARGGHGGEDPHQPRGGRRVRARARALRRRLRARARGARRPRDPHAGAPARAHRLCA
ncbi:MAG: MBL fold metallo-hydrolase, partial [Actinomycetota bacterium]|nr:MBL fold metallo-hydrolase [Actinomycetota bacterium]